MTESVRMLVALVLCAAVLAPAEAGAQLFTALRQGISTAGYSSTVTQDSATFSVQQAIGQASIHGLRTAGSIYLRQGFIQPPSEARAAKEYRPLPVTAYPNPASEQVWLRVETEREEHVYVELYTLKGQLLASYQGLSTRIVRLPLMGLSPGIYFLHVHASQQQRVLKISKL